MSEVQTVPFFPHAFTCECGIPRLVHRSERGVRVKCSACGTEHGPFHLTVNPGAGRAEQSGPNVGTSSAAQASSQQLPLNSQPQKTPKPSNNPASATHWAVLKRSLKAAALFGAIGFGLGYLLRNALNNQPVPVASTYIPLQVALLFACIGFTLWYITGWIGALLARAIRSKRSDGN
jgi:hypothetical protein